MSYPEVPKDDPKFLRNVFIGILLIVLIMVAAAYSRASEARYVEDLAPRFNGRTEVRLWDGTRADIINNVAAIEVDWAPKWAEGIGQALYYAQLTGKKPILVLLAVRGQNERHIYRAQTAGARAGVTVLVEWVQAPRRPDPRRPDRDDGGGVDIRVGPLDIVIEGTRPATSRAGKPIRAYMIEEGGQYLTLGIGDIRSWGPQLGAEIFTSLEKAKALQKTAMGRGRRSVIKAFLLLPVQLKDDETAFRQPLLKEVAP